MTTEEKIAFQNGFATGYKIAKGMVFKKKEQSEKLILTYNIASTTLKAFTLIEATNYTVDWGDGTVDSNTDTHVYSEIGSHTIRVTFIELNKIKFSSNTSLISVDGKLHSLSIGFDISGCFNGCTSLTSIPSGLFDNCVNVTNFDYCFSYCTSLTSIPSGLFDNCIKVRTFSNCFNECASLVEVPSGLFNNCINVTGLMSCFAWCTNLVSIPSGLFDNCINVTNFDSCFYGCSSLALIPSGLFDNCVNVTNFRCCFILCRSLTGNAPTLWERVNVTVYPACFYECYNLSNYADIPSTWK